jgi:hypothetical protein
MSRPFERRTSSPTHDACVATARVSLPAFARKKAHCLRNDSPNVMVNAYDHRTAHSHEENSCMFPEKGSHSHMSSSIQTLNAYYLRANNRTGDRTRWKNEEGQRQKVYKARGGGCRDGRCHGSPTRASPRGGRPKAQKLESGIARSRDRVLRIEGSDVHMHVYSDPPRDARPWRQGTVMTHH